MPSSSLSRPLRTLWLLCLLWGTAAVPSAHAAPCETASDCPARFACATLGQSACSPADAGSCRAEPIKACRSQGCYRSSDCPEDMVCAQDAERTSCVPRYLLRCTRAEDCGDGFDCVSSSEDCSEDAGARCASTRRCALRQTSCESTADCPSHFSCASQQGSSCDADAGSCPRTCLPPYAATDFALSGEARSLSGHHSRFDGRDHRHHDEGWSCSVTRPGQPAGALPVVLGLSLWGGRRRRAR
jgi:hypothetical protein